MRRHRLLLLVAALGCGGPQATGPGPTVAPTTSASGETPAWHIDPTVEFPLAEYTTGLGSASLHNDALRDAEQNLWRAVWHTTDAVPDILFALHSDIQVVERTHQEAKTTHVLLAVAHSDLREAIAELRDDLNTAREAEVATPREQIDQAIRILQYTSTLAAICRLHHEWVGDCGGLDEEAAKKTVQALAHRISLTPRSALGLPVRPNGEPLAALEVVASWQDDTGETAPIAEFPLVVEADAGVVAQAAGYSQADGVFSLPLLKAPGAPLTVNVDAWNLLRTHTALWPSISVTVPLRPLTAASARIAIKLDEGAQDVLATSVFAKNALAVDLKGRAHTLVDFTEEDAERLTDLEAREPNEWPKSAELTAAPDVICVGTAQSQFINRMGARSVWHEAKGTLLVYDAWSGKELGRLTEAVQAVGVGDENAAQKALEQLGRTLGQKLDALVATALK